MPWFGWNELIKAETFKKCSFTDSWSYMSHIGCEATFSHYFVVETSPHTVWWHLSIDLSNRNWDVSSIPRFVILVMSPIHLIQQLLLLLLLFLLLFFFMWSSSSSSGSGSRGNTGFHWSHDPFLGGDSNLNIRLPLLLGRGGMQKDFSVSSPAILREELNTSELSTWSSLLSLLKILKIYELLAL